MLKKSIFLLWLFLAIQHIRAQNSGDLKGFYGSLDLGLGVVNGNITSYEIETTLQFAMHLNIGYFVGKNVQLGLSASGWLYESFMWTGAEYQGESLSTSIIHLQVYPSQRYRWFIKGGYGISRYTNLQPYTDNGSGNAFLLASGIEKKFFKNEILIGTQISYQFGKLKYGNLYTTPDQLKRRFNVVDLTLFFGLD